jgi:hypothetical protein
MAEQNYSPHKSQRKGKRERQRRRRKKRGKEIWGKYKSIKSTHPLIYLLQPYSKPYYPIQL